MQTPSSIDPSFKQFLDDLKKQNNQNIATALLQLKTEREIAGEDNDKREEQLDNIGSKLTEIQAKLTGFSVEQLINNSENNVEVLKKVLEELSLIRKLSEGSLEYDKDSAQYRNTSGRELVSKVSGKDIKKGSYIDFESAADRLIGQGKRVRDQNILNLKPSQAVSSTQSTSSFKTKRLTPKQDESGEELDKTKYQGFFNELKSGIKFFLTDSLSEKKGYGLFQEPPKEVEKKKENFKEVIQDKIESTNTESKELVKNKIESTNTESKELVKNKIENVNSESDNIVTSQEILANNSKQDLELSKQLLDTTREQLKTLQQIKEALVPKTPSELPSQSPVVTSKEEREDTNPGMSDLASGAMDLLGGKKGAAAKAGQAGRRSLGSRLARFATGPGGKILGAAAAVGAGAYTAYQGYKGAEEEKQTTIETIDAKIKAGEITPEQGEQLKKEAAATATENKGGSVGEGTGMAAGAIGGGIAGAKVGATIGTFVGGPVGTAIGAGIGGLAGGAIGAISGSSVGKNIGGAIGKGVAGVKSFFGMEDTKAEKPQAGLSSKGDFSVAGPQGSIEGHHSNGKYYINGQEVSEKEYQNVRQQYGVDQKSKSAKDLLKQASTPTSSVTPVTPAAPVPTGSTVAKTTTENVDMSRQTSFQPSLSTPIISNNVSQNNTTKFVPVKSTPRPESQGSALDRYLSKSLVF